MEAGTGNLRGVQRYCPSLQGCHKKSQSPTGTESAEECQKQDGLVYINGKRKAVESGSPAEQDIGHGDTGHGEG